MHDIFLSYSHFDKAVADDICTMFEDLGISFFRDSRSIDLGQSITSEVKTALRKCKLLIVILSPGSLKSVWVPYEVGCASALGKKVIPFLAHPAVDLPLYMSDLSNTADISRLRDYIADYKRKPLDDPIEASPETLDDAQTEKLLRLHQSSIANYIARAVDRNLELIADDVAAFDVEIFFGDIHAAILKGRALCAGFRSRTLGDLIEYFERKFSATELKEQINSLAPLMLKVGNSLVKRRRLFETIEAIQERVFASFHEDLKRANNAS